MTQATYDIIFKRQYSAKVYFISDKEIKWIANFVSDSIINGGLEFVRIIPSINYEPSQTDVFSTRLEAK